MDQTLSGGTFAKYPIFSSIAADYAYGMYVREVLNKYHPQYEPELFRKIKSDIKKLKEEGFLQTNLLSVKNALLSGNL